MHIEKLDSCFGTNVIVDGKNWNDLDDVNKLSILKIVLDKIYEEVDLCGANIMVDVLQLLTPVESHYGEEPCDQCGSYLEEQIYEV